MSSPLSFISCHMSVIIRSSVCRRFRLLVPRVQALHIACSWDWRFKVVVLTNCSKVDALTEAYHLFAALSRFWWMSGFTAKVMSFTDWIYDWRDRALSLRLPKVCFLHQQLLLTILGSSCKSDLWCWNDLLCRCKLRRIKVNFIKIDV